MINTDMQLLWILENSIIVIALNVRDYFDGCNSLTGVIINVFAFSGIILVHDLTNRKSHKNLRKWLAEIFTKDFFAYYGFVSNFMFFYKQIFTFEMLIISKVLIHVMLRERPMF